MPLVNYPAKLRFDDWADEQQRWPALQCNAARGLPIPEAPFDRLRARHVFAYAGPSCYFRADAVGTSLLYFHPHAISGKGGGATAFDTGSLEPSTRTGFAVLQPWKKRQAKPDECRLDPGWLLDHNGTRGRELYAGDCGDRRAWTWELHVEGELAWSDLLAVQVPWDSFQIASEWVRQVDAVYSVEPEVWPLPYGEPADPDRPYDALYTESGRMPRERLEAPAS